MAQRWIKMWESVSKQVLRLPCDFLQQVSMAEAYTRVFSETNVMFEFPANTMLCCQGTALGSHDLHLPPCRPGGMVNAGVWPFLPNLSFLGQEFDKLVFVKSCCLNITPLVSKTLQPSQ